MKRRDFLTLLGGAAVWPVRSRAEEAAVRIGFLPLGSPTNRYDLSYVEAFRKGLVENDLIDGKNVLVDLLWVENEPEYDQAVLELIRRGAKILVPARLKRVCSGQTPNLCNSHHIYQCWQSGGHRYRSDPLPPWW